MITMKTFFIRRDKLISSKMNVHCLNKTSLLKKNNETCPLTGHNAGEKKASADIEGRSRSYPNIDEGRVQSYSVDARRSKPILCCCCYSVSTQSYAALIDVSTQSFTAAIKIDSIPTLPVAVEIELIL